MKVIDAMMKISRGEEVKFKLLEGSNIIYNLIHGCYLYDETNKEDVEWFINEEWLNREIKLIEEDKKIEEINEIEYCHQYDECWVKDKFYKDQKGNLVDEIIIDKVNEIIDVLNEMREDN